MSANRIYDTRTLGLDPRVVALFPRHRVLVVDDNVDTVDSEALLLEMLGQEVLRAYDGSSALRIAAQSVPEIVLLDLEMPRLSGFEVARELRKIPGMQAARIVAFTGLPVEQYRAATFASSFDEFINKPVSLTQIISILNQSRQDWVARRRS